ncbi:MAG TPA: formyltransferase family protein [Longimicrobiaceae bacterium]|nr:formyltransferase family protein [Longimicrobiaceae bacterium]
MGKRSQSVLFLGKKQDTHCRRALRFCQANFTDVSAFLGRWGERLPEDVGAWEGEYIISYLSRWVVPEYLLKRARRAAINFHPASPEYPGIGCNNFALYEGAREYGVTCHHMDATVDTGPIIAVKRFPVFPTDDVRSLLRRTYDYQLVLFYEIANLILAERELPACGEAWTRKPFTRKQFEALARITPGMGKEEITRRIRATTFGIWKPSVELGEFVFELKT